MPYNWYSSNHGSVLADAYYAGTIVYPEQFADVDIDAKTDKIYTFLFEEEGEDVYEMMEIGFKGGYGKLSLE